MAEKPTAAWRQPDLRVFLFRSQSAQVFFSTESSTGKSMLPIEPHEPQKTPLFTVLPLAGSILHFGHIRHNETYENVSHEWHAPFTAPSMFPWDYIYQIFLICKILNILMFLFLIFFAKFREKELRSQSKHFKANCSFQFEFLRQKRSYTSTTNFQNWSPVTVGLKSQKPHLPSSTEMASYAAAHRACFLGMAPFCFTEQSFLSLVSPRKGFVMLPRRVLGS